jgi:hypothetical protein
MVVLKVLDGQACVDEGGWGDDNISDLVSAYLGIWGYTRCFVGPLPGAFEKQHSPLIM